jgi:tRNA A-37 threonylcarbamoyl transferase component Bud32/tetratricopeptide (TPR) repeat protein
MSVFLERLRTALGADYEVMDELASGGMGVVYRARDRSLDRVVAIKVIQPDLATAQAAERFLREARALASFSHPNIVPVHRAGEADGIPYYVMEYLEGETLADRLKRGPLSEGDALRLADELLAALELVHERGIVHRDVKPSNIFLAAGRTVLSDFGISKATSADVPGLTVPGNIVGTPGYMPPEQLAGGDVNERTDVCAAGMVLFEACTGRPWTFDSHTEQADWSRVPALAAPAIQRALSWAPTQRWANAGEFRAALGGRARPPRSRRWIFAAAAAAAAGVSLVAWLVLRSPTETLLRVNVHPFAVDSGSDSTLGRAIAGEIVQALRAAADMEFVLDSARNANLDVRGTVEHRGDNLSVQLFVTGVGGARSAAFEMTAAGARSAIADSLARKLLLGIWDRRDSAFGDLPKGALPGSAAGMNAWLRAEALWAGAQWGAAERAYSDAIQIDSSCALCDLRLMVITRWLLRPPDTAITHRVLAALDRFPPRYQELVKAGLNTVDRWAALDRMIASSQRFDLAQFVYGDELFHRGALAGRSRHEALDHFQRTIDLRPRFAPAREHLAWVAIAEGDSATADSALSAYQALGAFDDPLTVVTLALLQVGRAWRFGPADDAAALTQATLDNPMIAAFPELPLGARYLSGFDAPAGVLWVGEHFEHWQAMPLLRAPGIVAQAVALTALGRVDSAHATLPRLRGYSSDPEYALSAGEFEAALVLFDSLDAAAALPRLDALLGRLTGEGNGTALQRRRAAWMLSLVARRAGATARARAWRALVTGETGRRPFATLLDAEAIGRSDPDSAVRLSETLLALDSAGGAGDPFFRSALHLMRAQWQVNSGDTTAAIRSLLWHENYDLIGHFEGVIEAADVDAAFGTVGRWYRARLLEQSPQGREVCSAWTGVARLWAEGDREYQRRAAIARTAKAQLGCPTP